MPFAKWVKKDRKIYSKLILYTSGDAGSLVEQFETARSGQLAWGELKKKYEPKGRGRGSRLISKNDGGGAT